MIRFRAGRMGLAGALALAAAPAPAAAHEFWIEPTTFHARVGEPVGVALRVGEDFKGRPVPRNPERIERFVSIGPEGEHPLAGRGGSDPAGVARFTAPGTHLLVYRGRRAYTEMDPIRFERYLEEKGLDAVIANRRGPGEAARGTREAYSRCAKSLVRAAETGVGQAAADRPVGLTLEIVAGSDPYQAGPGASIEFRILHEGRALAGTLVTATRRGAEDRKLAARTDTGGRVSFTLAEAGVWLIECVHMVEAPAWLDARWESLWASLTFDLPARRDTP